MWYERFHVGKLERCTVAHATYNIHIDSCDGGRAIAGT
jgi:hypothetical protein